MALTTSYQRLGQAYLGKSGGSLYVRVYARYSEQDITNNRSYVYLQARAYYENGTYITDKQASGNVSGAGLTKKSGSLSTIYTGETTIATTEGWVYHNSDGKKSISASGYLNFPNWGWSATASGSAELPTIPRHASITAAPNFTDEENPTINYSNPAGDAITSIQACIANTSGSVVYAAYRDIPKNGSSYKFELTEEEREALRWGTINSNTLTVRFYVTSVIGGQTSYSTLDKILTIANATPEITISAKDVGAASVALTGDENKIIKGFNYVLSSMSSTLKKGANIKSQTITNGSQSLIGEVGGTASMEGGFNNVESNTFTFGLTDSRGNTVNKYLTLDMIDYVKLTCNLTVEKPTVDGNMDFSVSGNYFNDTFGAQYNYLALEYRLKKEGEDWSGWTLIDSEYTLQDNKYSVDASISGLDYRKAYTIQVRAQDRINLIPSAEKTVKATPVYDWGKNDFNFNVPVTFEGKSLIDLTYPVGSKYYSNTDINPSQTLGGTWEKVRTLYGGELIAFGVAHSNSNSTSFSDSAEMSFSDIANKTYNIVNYGDEILAGSSGTICVYPRGIVGMLDVNVIISGSGGSGLKGFWWRGNKNELPSGVESLPSGTRHALTTGPIDATYGGCSHSYIYKVDEGVTDYFFINPIAAPYGGKFTPCSGGVRCILTVKAYARKGTTYEWIRTE